MNAMSGDATDGRIFSSAPRRRRVVHAEFHVGRRADGQGGVLASVRREGPAYGPTQLGEPSGRREVTAPQRDEPPKSDASVSRARRYLPGSGTPISRPSYVLDGWKLNTNTSGPRSKTRT